MNSRLPRRRAILAGVSSLLFASSPPRARGTFQAEPPVLLTSTPIFADLLRNLVGDGDIAIVRSVIPDGADPHNFEATPADLAAVAEAAGFIQMGAHLEPFVEAGAWRRAVDEAGIPHLILADHLPLIEVDLVIDHGDHVHDLRAGDPHVWLDPAMTLRMVEVLQAFAGDVLPEAHSVIAANSMTYREILLRLDQDLVDGLAAIPEARRQLVVFHDAFAYFATRFGFEIIGVILPNPNGEPNASDLAELVATIRRFQVPAIFTEPQFDRSLVESIAAEAGVAVGEILTDTFAGRVETYDELMRFNLASLVEHLGP